jgi:hypothetical protein
VAVVWAAFFNFLPLRPRHSRGKTVGGDLVNLNLIQEDYKLYVIFAGVSVRLVWNLITWYLDCLFEFACLDRGLCGQRDVVFIAATDFLRSQPS